MSIKAIAELTTGEVQAMMVGWGPPINAPNVLSLAMGTAYQATDPTKSALCIINFTSTASLTIGGGQTHTAEIVIGPTNAVSGGTGTVVCRYRNGQTGGVVVGVALNAELTVPCAFYLPRTWWYAPRLIGGTVTIFAAEDQSIG